MWCGAPVLQRKNRDTQLSVALRNGKMQDGAMAEKG
jgi:hypothetical protein